MRLGMGLGLGNLLSGNSLIAFPNEYSFNLDGSNDYLDCGNSTGIQFGGSFSVSFWFNTTDATATNEIFVSKNNDGVNQGWLVRLNSSRKLEFGVISTAITDSGSASNDGNWHHVVAVHESGVGNKLYKNGSLVASNSTGTDLTEHVPNLHIGNQDYSTPRAINSLIDEVALWDTALDATTISKIASKPRDLTKYSASNLKLWLRCGDKAEPESTTSIARADFSAEFDGSNDFINIADDSSLDITGSWTCSAWIKVGSGTGGYDRILGKQHTNAHCNYGIGLEQGIEFGAFLNDGGAVSGSAGFSAVYDDDDLVVGRWHHVAGVWDTEKLYAYVDGQLKATSADLSSTNSAVANDGALLIGVNQTNGSEYFKGDISSVSVHKTRLPANDIALMAKSRFTPMRDFMLKSVAFDGVDDYIDCGDLSYMDGVTQLTMTGWVKRLESNDRVTFEKSTGVNDRVGLNLDVDGVLYANVGTGSGGAWAYASLSGTDWNHIAMVYDGTQADNATRLNLYINGVKQSSNYGNTIPATTASTSGTFKIGRAINSSGHSSTGSVVGVAVYSEAKDADFIYAQYAKGLFGDWSADSGLIGYWKMGNGTGDAFPTIVDQSSNSNNGTITNGASDDIVENMVAGYDLGSFRGSEELGGELLGDPSFTVDNTDNITGTGTDANVTGGALVFVDPESPATGQTDIIFKNSGEQILVSGRMYKQVFTIADSGSPGARLKFEWITGHDHANYTDGTHTLYGLADQTSAEMDISSSSPSFKMTDMSIKEVLSSAVDDTKNGVIDVSNPVLGTEVNTLANALSPTNETDATTGLTSDGTISSVSSPTTSSNYSVKLVTTENGDGISASSNFTVEIGKLYKFSITWKTESNDHSMKHLIGTTAGSTNYVNLEGVSGSTEWVTSDYYFVTTHNILNFKFAEFTGDSDIVMYIDNISIKKVQGNVGTPTSMDATNFPYTSVLPDQSFLTGVNSAYNFIDLDGSNEYIDCGDGTSLDTTSAMTISMWFKRDGTSTDRLASRNDGGSNINWQLYIYSNNINMDYNIGSNRNIAGSTTLSADTWFHVVFTHDGTNQVLYINGSSDATGSHSGSINNGDVSLFLGRRTTGYFNGKIGQTALWNKGLSATEVSAIYNLGRHGNLLDSYSDNLVGYWAMSALDAKTGLSDVGNGTIYDRSGESNHGTATNTESADLNSSPNAESEGYDIESTTRTTTIP